MLRKSFIIIGIVLLVLGFFFLYEASRVSWDYVMEYKNTVDVGGPALVGDFGFGKCYPYPVNTPTLEMQLNDFLTVRCSDINETVYIALFENPPSNTTLLNYGTGLVSYTSHQNNLVFVVLYLAIPVNQNIQNVTLSTTTTLNHYQPPHWVYFGIGVVLSSLAVVSIVKSLSKPKPCRTKGSSQAERGT
jgi:hypothetical protein